MNAIREIVTSHISACAIDPRHARWCTTHQAIFYSVDCDVMRDALELAEAVAEKVRTPYLTYTKEFALRLNCVKNGCHPLHGDDGTIVPLEGWRWQDKWEESALAGHACDRMTRTVYFGLWEMEPEI